MKTEWQTVKVSDACEFVVDCVNKTAPLSASVTPYKMIRTSHIKNGFIRLTDEKCVSEETYKKWTRRASLEHGDVLLTREAPLGSVAMVRDEKNHFLGQRIVQYRSNPRVLDSLYLLYTFLSPALQSQFNSYGGTGSTVDHIRVPDCLEFEIPLPPLVDQKAIAHVLGTLDEKIELDRKTRETLEGTANALFKSWFVNFDPVRAKAEGRPTGLPNEISELFPDSFEDSELGEIPSGWSLMPLDKIANYLNGLALQKFPPKGDHTDLPVIKIAQLRKGDALESGKCSNELSVEYVIKDGDILFSWSGSLLVDVWVGGIGALNQHLFKVTSQIFEKWFYYLWTKYYLEEFQAIAQSKATTMGHIQRKHLSEALVLVPPPEVLEWMNSVFSPLLNRQIQGRLESRTLSSIRDALLPRLISGELRVPDVEKMLEEVGV